MSQLYPQPLTAAVTIDNPYCSCKGPGESIMPAAPRSKHGLPPHQNGRNRLGSRGPNHLGSRGSPPEHSPRRLVPAGLGRHALLRGLAGRARGEPCGLTAAIAPMENPYRSCKGVAGAAVPYGEPLPQL